MGKIESALPEQRSGQPWRRRTGPLAISVAVSLLVLLGSATGLTVLLSTSSSPKLGAFHSAGKSPTVPPCAAPVTVSPVEAPTRLGRWPFHLFEAGAFQNVMGTAQGELVALQACGHEESSLRVIRMDPRDGAAVASRSFPDAALLASSLTASGHLLFFGQAKLALSGSASMPPYALSLEVIDPASMRVVSHFSLGRGYGLALSTAATGTVIACT
ncbi:MAG: hypothetical protein ACRDZT_09790, partial [Acidimicrobiales bacterium]